MRLTWRYEGTPWVVLGTIFSDVGIVVLSMYGIPFFGKTEDDQAPKKTNYFQVIRLKKSYIHRNNIPYIGIVSKIFCYKLGTLRIHQTWIFFLGHFIQYC